MNAMKMRGNEQQKTKEEERIYSSVPASKSCSRTGWERLRYRIERSSSSRKGLWAFE